MATLDEAGNLTLWDFEALQPVARAICQPSPHYLIQGFGLEWSPGNLIAAHCAVGILLYDTNLNLHSRWESRPHSKFTWMAGGKWLTRADSELLITDIATNSTVLHLPPRWQTEFCTYTHLAADPLGDTVLFVDDGGHEDIGMITEGPLNPKELTLLEVSTNRLLRSMILRQNNGILLLSFDPWRGCYWVLTHQSGPMFWDKKGNSLSQGHLSGRVLGVAHSQRFSVALQSNGATNPMTVLIWGEEGRGELPISQQPKAGWVGLSPDGRWVLLPEGKGMVGYEVG